MVVAEFRDDVSPPRPTGKPRSTFESAGYLFTRIAAYAFLALPLLFLACQLSFSRFTTMWPRLFR